MGVRATLFACEAWSSVSVDSTVSLVGPGSEVAALAGGTHVLAVDYAKAVRTLVVPQTSAPIVTRKTTVERSYAQS